MSAQIDTYAGRQAAWHKLGWLIPDEIGAREAALRYGLAQPVEQYELYAQLPDGTFVKVDSHVANFRTKDGDGNDCNELLGVVGSEYQVCQNLELADFTDALAQTGKVVIETCGTIRAGKKVWFLARGDSFTIGGADEMRPYVLVSNSHDGTNAIRVTPTTVRVVCNNTLHMVIPNVDDQMTTPETAAITIRHTGRIADKLEQAKRAMAHYGETLKRNRELFEALQTKKIDAEQRMKLFADVYAANWEAATTDDLQSADEEIRRVAQNRANRMAKASEAFMARWQSEQEALGLGDTAWAAFNAMSGFIQHDKRARGSEDSDRVERRLDSNLFGLNAVRTHQALASAMAMC